MLDNRRETRGRNLIPYLEMKRNVHKEDQTFSCNLVHYQPDYVVISMPRTRPFVMLGSQLDPGGSTVAHFWNDRGYALYEFLNPGDRVVGYYFHLLSDVLIREDSVEYKDLLLDLWVYPDGRWVELDRDELDDCAQKGLISQEEMESANRWAKEIVRNFNAIVSSLYRDNRARL
ncbi:MAG: DUF402 domain-containing protein [Candidatus Tectomicrobia bacterium]|nr:DUF402 domain-containing protein [Candidatus Tectomicrobia bacterium]